MSRFFIFFFFIDTATTEIYTLSLHDALPIYYSENIVWVMPEDILLTGKRFLYVRVPIPADNERRIRRMYDEGMTQGRGLDRKSTRLNSSHTVISYAVFCLKKKKKTKKSK